MPSTEVLTVTEPVEREADWTGSYRLYFNAKEEHPKVWSIDDGDPTHEIKVEEVYLYTNAATRFVPSETQPIAWLEGYGRVVVAAGVAIIDDTSVPVVKSRPASDGTL
jgi:hypothetical protein